MMRSIYWFCFALCLFFSAGCYRHHLYVQQEWVDRDFLASSHLGTPDPRQCDPPEGQRLLIAWQFPRSYYSRGLSIIATVRFWDDTQVVREIPVIRKRSYKALFFRDQKILTYRVDVVTQDGEILETWKHQFWTELIEVGNAAARKSSAVSSHPRQVSVIERPCTSEPGSSR
jgi:hypothetical protein